MTPPSECYDAFLPKTIPLMILYVGFLAFNFILIVKLLQKWRARRRLEGLILPVGYLFFEIAVGFIFAGLLHSWINDYFTDFYRLTFPVAYTSALLANLSLLVFASKIFDVDRRLIGVYAAGVAVTAVLLFLPTNYWGVASLDSCRTAGPSIRLLTSVLVLVLSFFDYGYLAWGMYREAKQTTEPVPRAGLRLIGLAMVFLVLFFLNFSIDTVMILVTGEGYSVFVYLAWICAGVFLLLGYLGFVMPDFLRARVQREKPEA